MLHITNGDYAAQLIKMALGTEDVIAGLKSFKNTDVFYKIHGVNYTHFRVQKF